ERCAGATTGRRARDPPRSRGTGKTRGEARFRAVSTGSVRSRAGGPSNGGSSGCAERREVAARGPGRGLEDAELEVLLGILLDLRHETLHRGHQRPRVVVERGIRVEPSE